MKNETAWRGFREGVWCDGINVSNFIKLNYTQYNGDSSFLEGPTERTNKEMKRVKELLIAENEKGGVLDVDTSKVLTILSHEPGYVVDKDTDIIVGLQTDAPLKRGVSPFAGFRNAVQACNAYGYEMSEKIKNEFTYRTTHNTGVFRAYNDTMKKARHAGILTGLPDAYARGRIIGDYRRIALYGMDYLIEQKKYDKAKKRRSIFWKISPNSSNSWRRSRRSRSPTATISPSRRRTRAKRFSGSISAISARSKSRTAPPTRSAASPNSSTSILSAISKKAF